MELVKSDELTEKKYSMNNFDPSKEISKFSYTSGRVLKSVYNLYEPDNFKVYGYYTDWSQYDGRDPITGGKFEDGDCGRGVDLMKMNPFAYDKLILGFAGIVGDKGSNANKINTAAQQLGLIKDEVTFIDLWGDLASYYNCGHSGYKSEDYKLLYNELNAQGVIGGLRLLKQTNPNLILAFSIGGWTMSEAFHWVASNANSRLTFAKSIVKILKTFSFFTEIDIDWEYPCFSGNGNTYDDNDAKNYVELIKVVRNELDNSGLSHIKISIAAAADVEKLKKSMIKELLNVGVWNINLMTYDFFGIPWAPKLAHHTNLYGNDVWSVDSAVKYLKSIDVPLKRVFIGFAEYTRNAQNAEITSYSPLKGTYKSITPTTVGTFESGATENYDLLYNYLDMDNKCGKNGFILYTDEVADADYLYNPDLKLFMSIETPRTIKAKAEYVKKNNLGGMFNWTSDLDAGLTLNACREGFGSKIKNKTIDMSKYFFKGKTSPSSSSPSSPNTGEISLFFLPGSNIYLSIELDNEIKKSDINYKWVLPDDLMIIKSNSDKSEIFVRILDIAKEGKKDIVLNIIDSSGNLTSYNHTIVVHSL